MTRRTKIDWKCDKHKRIGCIDCFKTEERKINEVYKRRLELAEDFIRIEELQKQYNLFLSAFEEELKQQLEDKKE